MSRSPPEGAEGDDQVVVSTTDGAGDRQPLFYESKPRWWINLLLFVLTLGSVWHAGGLYTRPEDFSFESGVPLALSLNAYADAWLFALPLLGILVFHEFGHWVAARLHGVPASLPYFIPMPVLSPFGTMGAVIAMPGRIRSRNALLDIGAAGPLAGLALAIPLMLVGLALSPVGPLSTDGYHLEGQCLLYSFLKWCVFGSLPAGYDVTLHATAFAAWVGLLVTMINLVPWGQLDGGHVAYALFGERQHRYARWLRLSLLLLVAYNLMKFAAPVLSGETSMPLEVAIGNSAFWFWWFVLTAVLGRLFGHHHPPFEPGVLSRRRRLVGVVSLLLFVLLFMPTPYAVYPGDGG